MEVTLLRLSVRYRGAEIQSYETSHVPTGLYMFHFCLFPSARGDEVRGDEVKAVSVATCHTVTNSLYHLCYLPPDLLTVKLPSHSYLKLPHSAPSQRLRELARRKRLNLLLAAVKLRC